MSSAFDPFVSFVVKLFCTSAKGANFFSRPFVAPTSSCLPYRHRQALRCHAIKYLDTRSSRNPGVHSLRAPRPRR